MILAMVLNIKSLKKGSLTSWNSEQSHHKSVLSRLCFVIVQWCLVFLDMAEVYRKNLKIENLNSEYISNVLYRQLCLQ